MRRCASLTAGVRLIVVRDQFHPRNARPDSQHKPPRHRLIPADAYARRSKTAVTSVKYVSETLLHYIAAFSNPAKCRVF